MTAIPERRNFLKTIGLSAFVSLFPGNGKIKARSPKPDSISDFANNLIPIGRILETEGYYVWCNSPIYTPDGKIHVFYSRWPEKYGMGGWIHKSEIAHAVADTAESEFKFIDIILKPTPETYYSSTCHNPSIYQVDGNYCLFFMGNTNGKTDTKRIGLATSNSVNGPWQISELPILDTGTAGSWDDHCTTNPAFLRHPSGKCWLYYKSWNTAEYEKAQGQKIRANRKYGLAIADKPEGPYLKIAQNPVIDFSVLGENKQLEDAYLWFENGKFRLIARDMGFFSYEHGLYFESEDGIHWTDPKIAYFPLSHYIKQDPAPAHLTRYGRIERPQLLMRNGLPDYLFGTSQGGKYQTSSGFIMKISQ